MSDTREQHSKAMVLYELARIERRGGDQHQFLTLLKESLALEIAAADSVSAMLEFEPTRSVLHRSAASIALELGDIATAERYIGRALAGFPPAEIAVELRDLYEQVNFARHLDVRGVELRPEEIQLSIAGKGVNFGMAPYDAFIDRVGSTEKLLYRTAERKMAWPYREQGRLRRNVEEGFRLYLSVPRAASFAVSLKIGQSNQLGFDFAPMSQVLDEFLDCMQLFSSADTKQLRERITDSAYYRNFVALARRIAPDGRDVEFVGFSTLNKGQSRHVSLSRPVSDTEVENELMAAEQQANVKGERITVTGFLRRADALHESDNKISLKPARGKTITFTVPEGMMDDIVRPMWGTEVIAIGLKTGPTTASLIDIHRAEPTELPQGPRTT